MLCFIQATCDVVIVGARREARGAALHLSQYWFDGVRRPYALDETTTIQLRNNGQDQLDSSPVRFAG
jgi:hypothetical protein